MPSATQKKITSELQKVRKLLVGAEFGCQTVRGAAASLRVSDAMVKSWIASGRLLTVRVGRRRMIPKSEIARSRLLASMLSIETRSGPVIRRRAQREA